jgi:hypothetical protein
MKSFFHICNSMTVRLGRNLHEEELLFLQRLYERYTIEQQETEVKQREYNLGTANS